MCTLQTWAADMFARGVEPEAFFFLLLAPILLECSRCSFGPRSPWHSSTCTSPAPTGGSSTSREHRAWGVTRRGVTSDAARIEAVDPHALGDGRQGAAGEHLHAALR